MMGNIRRTLRNVALIVSVVAGLALTPGATVQAGQTDLVGPAGSGSFGKSVTALPNGNIVVIDPYYDAGSTADVGAVYLYNGATGTLISTLTGSTASDRVGSYGVTVLSNGNYVVGSPYWDNGGAADAGAATWGSGTTGVSGVVSSANSLVGSTSGDQVGYGAGELSNGNYLVFSRYWDNGGAADAGAVTWGDGTTGVSGVVSAANSLVGSTSGDQVGYGGTLLSNGNYVVSSPYWDNGGATDAGAVTWGDGTTGASGVVSSTNSLVGSTSGDQVGFRYDSVTVLSNDNYVVSSPDWDNGGIVDAGAVTWGDGTTGVSGVVSSTNSLVGSTSGDQVGYGGYTYDGVVALSNGNYVVRSYYWDNGGATDVGAVTWGDGTTGISGVISSSNSLVGSTADDQVGNHSVTALNNGNYVVPSPDWDNGGIVDAGAVTWGDGTMGISGIVSSTNSLVGSTSGDQVGSGDVTALSNGNYVVSSQGWDNNAGAVTWGNGTTGISGVVSVANSLVGSTTDNQIGSDVTALSNGNYVVCSPNWDNGGATNVGAVTWGGGTTGVSGVVSSANSLVGSTSGDQVSYGGVGELSNGNYVVFSYYWDNGGATDAGAVTWGSGTSGVSGVVSSANSLVGSTAGDQVGYAGTLLSNGNYVVSSPDWDNGGAADAGAVTWGDGTTGVSGVVSSANSLVGGTAGDQVGYNVKALSNGNYVVNSPGWDNGGAADAGAVTWGDGATGVSGAISSANSLVGSTSGDQVGYYVTVLNNGNYVVRSWYWDNGGTADVGSVTWGDGTTGISGVVSAANSLVGSTANDRIGSIVRELSDGSYVVLSYYWDNGGTVDAGAVTWGNGMTGVSGAITAENSVRGTAAGGGTSMVWAYDDTNGQLVVGRPADNIVTLFIVSYRVYLPLVLRSY